MLSSTPNLKFLLDENVRVELARFLRSKGFDCKRLGKGTDDKILRQFSKAEKRIVVTNDDDFTRLSAKKVFAVIWLKIPQNDPQTLLSSFKKLLKECSELEGHLIILTVDSWKKCDLGKANKA